MKYTLAIILALSLPALAAESNLHDFNHKESKASVLQKKIQSTINKGEMCDPKQELHLPPFN